MIWGNAAGAVARVIGSRVRGIGSGAPRTGTRHPDRHATPRTGTRHPRPAESDTPDRPNPRGHRVPRAESIRDYKRPEWLTEAAVEAVRRKRKAPADSDEGSITCLSVSHPLISVWPPTGCGRRPSSCSSSIDRSTTSLRGRLCSPTEPTGSSTLSSDTAAPV